MAPHQQQQSSRQEPSTSAATTTNANMGDHVSYYGNYSVANGYGPSQPQQYQQVGPIDIAPYTVSQNQQGGVQQQYWDSHGHTVAYSVGHASSFRSRHSIDNTLRGIGDCFEQEPSLSSSNGFRPTFRDPAIFGSSAGGLYSRSPEQIYSVPAASRTDSIGSLQMNVGSPQRYLTK